MIRYTFIFLLLLSPKAFADQMIVAVVDLKFIKDTGETAGVICFDKENQECSPWSTYYLFEAKVKRKLSGKLSSNIFKVIYGRHALKKGNMRNVVVSLDKLNEEKEADYKVIEIAEHRQMYCFSGEYNQPNNVNDLKEGNQLKCFEKEH